MGFLVSDATRSQLQKSGFEHEQTETTEISFLRSLCLLLFECIFEGPKTRLLSSKGCRGKSRQRHGLRVSSRAFVYETVADHLSRFARSGSIFASACSALLLVDDQHAEVAFAGVDGIDADNARAANLGKHAGDLRVELLHVLAAG